MITIKRSGNVLEVSPPALGILDPVLRYDHCYLNYDSRASDLSPRIVNRGLYRIKDDKLYTTQGALHRITKALDDHKIPYTYTNLDTRPPLEPDYEHLERCLPQLQLRVRQDEILANLIGRDSGVIVAPTAYGKTFIMLALVALYPNANIIITSPQVTLLQSVYRRLLRITPYVGRVGGGHNKPAKVTLTTYASLLKAPVDKCDILLFDEVHRLAAPQTSMQVAKIRAPRKIFGMTATARGRSDGAELVTEVLVGPVVARVKYDEAVEAGVIAPIRVAMIDMPRGCCALNSGTKRTRVAKKRLCYWRNTVRNGLFAQAVSTYPQKLGIRADPQVLILVATVEHAFRLKLLLPDFVVVYAGLSKDQHERLSALGLLPPNYKALTRIEREQMLRDFEDGVLHRVIATGTWGEGVDFVHLDVLANLSGERSPITTIQWAGRNSRLSAQKTFGLVIDCNDAWDNWAEGRADARVREYKRNKWEIVNAT